MSKLYGKEQQFYNILELFNNDKEVALAVFLQNRLHPKNDQRVNAIKSGSYVEINSAETARILIRSELKKNLEIELVAAESEVNKQAEKLA